MSNLDPLQERNRAWAESGVWRRSPRLPFLPHRSLYIVTCIDPRTDPGQFLGLEFADAIIARTVGGRATPAVVRDVAYIGYLVETKAPEGPYFEVAVVHHTDCGSALLADDDLRHDFARRSGYDDTELAALPVLDPTATVRHDVDRLLAAPEISDRLTISGHVYDVASGLLSTVAEPAHPHQAMRADATTGT